jgi:hypothetical protein
VCINEKHAFGSIDDGDVETVVRYDVNIIFLLLGGKGARMLSVDSSIFFEAQKTPADYIAAAVEDARHNIETVALPTNPRDPSNGILAWRIRPSEMRATAVQDYLEPPPEWGLKVNLANMYIGPNHTRVIAHALILNHTVTTLDLSFCDMGTDAAIELAHCLERNTTLKHLNVTGNLIGPEGGASAASLLKKLETLHIACNELRDEGAAPIADALKASTTIKFLNVRGNNIRLHTLYRMIEALDPTVFTQLSDELKTELATSRAAIREDEAKAKARKRQAAKEATTASQNHYPASHVSSPLLTTANIGSPSSERGSVSEIQGATPNLMRRQSVSSFLASSQNNGESSASPQESGFATKKGRSRHALSLERAENDGDGTSRHSPATVAVERPLSPIGAPPAGAPKCSSCNALWVHGNLDPVPKELLDHLNKILTTRVPQPPDGLNAKKKKGKKAK